MATAPRTIAPRALPLALLCLAAAACAAPPMTTPPPPPPDAGALTYHRDIKPILDARCTGCHQTGGAAPFALGTYAEVASRVALVRAEVDARRMPPWPPERECAAYHADRSLSDEARAAVLRWIDEGHPEGDAAQPGAPLPRPADGLSRVDLRLAMPAAYTPPTTTPDDYRCFLVPWTEAATRFVTGFRAEPGNGSVVHHAIAYIALPSDVAAYTALDANDATPGWSCFGGPGLTNVRPRWIGSWTPGSRGADFPEGTGIRMEPGSAVVLQVHYHPEGVANTTDQSSLAFRLAERVEREALVVPFTNPAWAQQRMMPIPAGEADVTHRFEVDLSNYLPLLTAGAIPAGPYRIYSTNLHMHTLGARGRLEVVRGGASANTCLLSVPRWDFHWQGAYFLQQPVEVRPGDRLALECHFDNSPARQPVVDGRPAAPRDVNWGEGTADEMCLSGIYITQ